ncbi:MAG: hypothetical protein PHN49_01200 [Candidatus Omnitrophica bacterium]|nr:hypothetical protein [Candidatus Omnitrophota bacterium]
MAKVDVHGHEQRYKTWKDTVVVTGEAGLTKANSDILIQYVFDMEIGANVSKNSRKGARSYPRLNNIRQRLAQMMRMLQDRGIKNVANLSERQVTDLFNDMRKGVIKTAKGEKYKSAGDYTKIFQAFWRWWIKVNKKNGKSIPDLTEDLDTSSDEPRFVSISKEDLDKMLPYFTQDEQVVLLFVFDSLIRTPTELLSLNTRDIFERSGEVWVNIPKEISKTIGRTLNLLYSGKAVLEHIKRNDLKPDDHLFTFSYPIFSEKLQEVAEQVFGNKISEGGEFYKNMTLYDLRHSGAIHLRIIAHKTKKINIDALRQRGGWTDFKMLNYYTKFLGLTGEIDSNDLLVEADKSKLEKEIDGLSKENKKIWKLLGKMNSINQALMEAAKKDKKTEVLIKKYLRDSGRD